jgi:hypothetical protein
MGSRSRRELVGAKAETARKGSAAAPKLTFPSLRHVASYASFAIHLGEFSHVCEKWRSARAIKLRNVRLLR